MQAIYARQSADKKDSISIETQIADCKMKLKGKEEFQIFSDRGYSGKSTDRPKFQEMMMQVRQGNISRIIIYKLDRISRSLIDFLNMQMEFTKYEVELVSYSEEFDTSNPIGNAILKILMTFAEMERETIQKRITDNYYARGEKGFYLGGPPPFGYQKIETNIDGKKTYTFQEDIRESTILKKMYEDYSNGKSLSAIARQLNDQHILTRKHKAWNAVCIARMLKNPVYVKANADVYKYLVELGATMNNAVEDYVGKNGCYVYGNEEKREGTKFVSMKNDYVTLGLHEGIIEPSVWLYVQYIFNQKKGHSNLGTGSLTWLQGLIKCGCGYTYYVKRCKTSVTEHKYLYCRGRKNNTCPYPRTMLPVERLERIVEEALLERLKKLRGKEQDCVIRDTPEINALKIQVTQIDNKIQNLINRIADGNDIAMDYFNHKIHKLDREKGELQNHITELELKGKQITQQNRNINDILTDWEHYELEIKKKIAKEVIEKIVLEGETVRIHFY